MVKIVAGTMGRSPFLLTKTLSTPEQFSQFFTVCKENGVEELDSARIYGGGESEKIMSSSLKDFNFKFSTKIATGSLKREAILASAEKSFQDLQVDSVDIFYIHRPDRETALEETCSAINELYKQGKFKRFGISAYRADEVQDVYNICKKENYILPTVYQGIFNPVTRRAEFDLFPTLQKLKIAFYAYGPLASGLLIKPVDELLNAQSESRFGALPFIAGLYLKDSITSQVKLFQNVCKNQGIPPIDATFRYLLHHSALGDKDGIIIGASDVTQLETNLKATKGGPLPVQVVQAFEDLWSKVKEDAAPYHN